MAEVIDLTAELNRRAGKRLRKIKQELDQELRRLDYNLEDELNKYVIFDTARYYELSQEDPVTKQSAINMLLTAKNMLVQLNEQFASSEVENIITRLENNSYER